MLQCIGEHEQLDRTNGYAYHRALNLYADNDNNNTIISAPNKPTFESRTSESITVRFAQVQDDRNQLTYNAKAVDPQLRETTGPCDRSAAMCTVERLQYGINYSLYVRACISKKNSPDELICGNYSSGLKVVSHGKAGYFTKFHL